MYNFLYENIPTIQCQRTQRGLYYKQQECLILLDELFHHMDDDLPRFDIFLFIFLAAVVVTRLQNRKKKKGKINNRKSNFDCWTPPAEEKLGCAHQSKLDFLLYEIPTTIPLKKSQPHQPLKRLYIKKKKRDFFLSIYSFEQRDTSSQWEESTILSCIMHVVNRKTGANNNK